MGQHDKEKAVRRVIFRLVLGFMILAIFTYLLSVSVTSIVEYNDIIDDVSFSGLLLGLSFELARERGLTNIWLASNGTNGYPAVLAQRTRTNKAITNFNGQPPLYTPSITHILNTTSSLPTLRSSADHLTITPPLHFDTYTSIITTVLDTSGQYSLSGDSRISTALMARFYLAQLIEYRGQLRGTFSAIFQLGYWQTPDWYRRILTILAQLDAYNKEMLRYVTDSQRAALVRLLGVNATAVAMAETERLVGLALASTNATVEAPFGVDPSLWFNTSTVQINSLNVFYQQISADVVERTQTLKWWDVLVVVLGFLLEIVSLTEMIVALVPIVKLRMQFSGSFHTSPSESSPKIGCLP